VCRGKGDLGGARRCPGCVGPTGLAKHNERRRNNRAIKANVIAWARQEGCGESEIARLEQASPKVAKDWARDRGADPEKFIDGIPDKPIPMPHPHRRRRWPLQLRHHQWHRRRCVPWERCEAPEVAVTEHLVQLLSVLQVAAGDLLPQRHSHQQDLLGRRRAGAPKSCAARSLWRCLSREATVMSAPCLMGVQSRSRR
jgi:hypothetical protein